jgi:hypothetical protein
MHRTASGGVISCSDHRSMLEQALDLSKMFQARRKEIWATVRWSLAHRLPKNQCLLGEKFDLQILLENTKIIFRI